MLACVLMAVDIDFRVRLTGQSRELGSGCKGTWPCGLGFLLFPLFVTFYRFFGPPTSHFNIACNLNAERFQDFFDSFLLEASFSEEVRRRTFPKSSSYPDLNACRYLIRFDIS